MTVYVDNAFEFLPVPKKWDGGGHLQADALDELHAFAASIGLKRSWFQTKPGRPEHDHYDLTAGKRRLAIAKGAIDEDVDSSVERHARVRTAFRPTPPTSPGTEGER